MRYVLLLFVVVPLAELYLLLWLGTLIGFWPTVAITLITGLVGGSLAKREGLRVWRAWHRALEQMRPPEEGVIEGLLVLVGGVLLITPGILTDFLGFALLLPPTRRRVAARVRSAVDRRIASGTLHVSGGFAVPRPDPPPRRIIDTTGEEPSDDEPESEPQHRRYH